MVLTAIFLHTQHTQPIALLHLPMLRVTPCLEECFPPRGPPRLSVLGEALVWGGVVVPGCSCIFRMTVLLTRMCSNYSVCGVAHYFWFWMRAYVWPICIRLSWCLLACPIVRFCYCEHSIGRSMFVIFWTKPFWTMLIFEIFTDTQNLRVSKFYRPKNLQCNSIKAQKNMGVIYIVTSRCWVMCVVFCIRVAMTWHSTFCYCEHSIGRSMVVIFLNQTILNKC